MSRVMTMARTPSLNASSLPTLRPPAVVVPARATGTRRPVSSSAAMKPTVRGRATRTCEPRRAGWRLMPASVGAWARPARRRCGRPGSRQRGGALVGPLPRAVRKESVVKIGVHVPDFTYPGGAATLGSDLARIADGADAAGIDRLSVMDHLWQIPNVGPVDHDMLEAYTALGFLAAHSSRVKLLTLVTGVTYRDPGLLAKAVTTLDVLSGGRAMFGVGAAWNEEESRGLGLFFPPTAERFERLEETLHICLQMWSGSDAPPAARPPPPAGPPTGPRALSKPPPPILIGGGGEKKTLRLVAKYADACNLFPGPQLRHKLD